GGLTSVALVASSAGGILFGRLADAIGRVRAMTISILLYSFATAGLATSTALWQLIAWRIAVGIGMGGEWSCGSVLVAETWPAQHRAKAMGIMQSGWAIGALIAAALSALILGRFGWRVLFLIGVLPAAAAFFIRRNVEEPPLWRERKREPSRWSEMFSPPFLRRTVVATLLARSVLIAVGGVSLRLLRRWPSERPRRNMDWGRRSPSMPCSSPSAQCSSGCCRRRKERSCDRSERRHGRRLAGRRRDLAADLFGQRCLRRPRR